MGPSDDGDKHFMVEEPEPNTYNPTGAEPAVWQPAPDDILRMFQQLESGEALPLKWVCPGRRPPEKEVTEKSLDFMSDGEDDDDEQEEEKRAPEPSAFDFDDTLSEASAKVKLTPRTPVSAQAKRPEKKLACMDNVLKSIKRQQKAEREARKSQARTMGASPFRANTPSRGVSGFSPAASPRLPSSTSSPGPSSPRVAAPTSSPLQRASGSGDAALPKQGVPSSPQAAVSGKGTPSPSAAPGPGVTASSSSSSSPPPQPPNPHLAPDTPTCTSETGPGLPPPPVSVAAVSSSTAPQPVAEEETGKGESVVKGDGDDGVGTAEATSAPVAMEMDQDKAADAGKST